MINFSCYVILNMRFANNHSCNSTKEIVMFFSNMQIDINAAFFAELSRLEQNSFLQSLYDKGHSVPDIAKKMGLQEGNIYKRINAHRGRSSILKA